jgi:hypothetical protein
MNEQTHTINLDSNDVAETKLQPPLLVTCAVQI